MPRCVAAHDSNRFARGHFMSKWPCTVLTALLTLGSLNVAAAQQLSLRYAQAYSAAHSIFSLPVSVAQREGLFRREGLNVSIVIPVPGGSDKMIAALHDDWADVTHVATPFLIRAALAGSDAVAIDTEFKNPIYSLIARPEIASFAGLKGKLIGLADEEGTITISMRKLLAMHGLNAGNFAVKVQEGTPGRYNCLRSGDCDAVVLGQPQDLQAIAEGYRLLGRSTEAVPDFLYTVTAARRSWGETHKEALVRFVRGMAASFAFIRAPENRDRVVKLVAETLGCPENIAAQTLDLFLKPGSEVLPARGEIDLAALQQVVGMMGEAGLLKPPLPRAMRFVDLDYLR